MLMENPTSRSRHQGSDARLPSPSPRLSRSRSGNSAPSLPAQNRVPSTNSTQRLENRSKSTTRARTQRNEENVNPTTIIASMQKKPQDQTKDGIVRFLQRGSPRNSSVIKGSKSFMSSPSAWALSPGRSSPLVVVAQELQGYCGTGVRTKSTKVGAVNGVLKFFRQKKVSPLQEEEYHRFRVYYNRMLQWRFVNARAEASTASLKIDAEDKVFSVWLRILKIRNSTLEKRILLQKLRNEIKLHQIVGPQLCLLNEWVKLERKNYEAVSRVIRKLSAILVRVPLIQEAKADVESIHEAISSAVAVMDGIEATIIKIFSQPTEKLLYLITELISMMEQQNECLEELENVITLLVSSAVSEQSLRAHLVQDAKELR